MAITSKTLIPNKLFMNTAVGLITIQEIADKSIRFWQELDVIKNERSGSVDVIWDFRLAIPANPGFDKIDQLSSVLSTGKTKPPSGCSVIISPDDPSKYLISYFVESLAKKFRQRDLKIVNNLEAAYDYVGY